MDCTDRLVVCLLCKIKHKLPQSSDGLSRPRKHGQSGGLSAGGVADVLGTHYTGPAAGSTVAAARWPACYPRAVLTAEICPSVAVAFKIARRKTPLCMTEPRRRVPALTGCSLPAHLDSGSSAEFMAALRSRTA